MRKNNISILTIILISTILRFYKIGIVPQGLSLEEVKFGLLLSNISAYFANPIVVRVPFAVLGIVSVYLMYVLIKKYSNSENVALFSSVLTSFLPWHLQESRIFSYGIIFLVVVQVVLIYIHKRVVNPSKNVNYFAKIIMILIAISVLVPLTDARDIVNANRLLVTNSSPKILSKVFVNKYIESFRLREKAFFENLDFGMYFFNGHPRERWGIEESNKLFLFLIPLIVLGLFKVDKKHLKHIMLYFVLFLLFSTITTDKSLNLVLIIPFVALASIGTSFNKISPSFEKYLYFGITILAIYEILNFNMVYFGNKNNSLFSPRRVVYQDLTKKLSDLNIENANVLVNDKIGDAEIYFKFYLKNNLNGYEFRSFNILKESQDKNKMYVDIVPNEAGPSEPLYTKDGTLPNMLEQIAVFDYFEKRSKVFIYKFK